MTTDPAPIRKIEETLIWAVAGALKSVPLLPEDQGAKKLAEEYAAAIDLADDRAKALEVLGPKLLATLESLGATPSARAKVAKGVIPGGPTRLQLLRDARGS